MYINHILMLSNLFFLLKSFEELKCVKAELSTQCEELSQSNETLSASVKYNNFKINNFDIVKRYDVVVASYH